VLMCVLGVSCPRSDHLSSLVPLVAPPLDARDNLPEQNLVKATFRKLQDEGSSMPNEAVAASKSRC